MHWAILAFVVLVVAGLIFAALHHLRVYQGNFWEHMEWMCFGVAIGLGFATGAPITDDGRNEMILLGVIVAIFGHLCMDTISWAVMRVLGHKPTQEGE